jgi:hypothetical protein
MSHDPLSDLSDVDLIAEVKTAAAGERRATAALVALLAELDARKLFLDEGCSSLFLYCTQVLRLSEHAAYGRIAAARASRRVPAILELLASGAITLTTVVLLAPHLTDENHEALLEGACHKTKVEVERLIACLHPQPDIESQIRKIPLTESSVSRGVDQPAVPTQGTAELSVANPRPSSSTAAARATVAPLAPERYLVKVTVSREAHDKLRRAQDLLRHVVPTGDPAAIIERALTMLVDQLERTKLAQVRKPGVIRAVDGTSRHVSASVKRAVWNRDGGRCAFVGTAGRCTETGFLEFHHIVPFADGGPTTAENLSLRCRAHNAHEATALFGERHSRRARYSEHGNDGTA